MLTQDTYDAGYKSKTHRHKGRKEVRQRMKEEKNRQNERQSKPENKVKASQVIEVFFF